MIFFTSDLHFGHVNVIKYCNRPFDSLEQMNEMLVLNWNTIVFPTDTVYVVGDFAMGAAENVTKYGPRLNGNKILVPGNHDRCHEILHHGKHGKKLNGNKLYYDAGFQIAPYEVTLEVGDPKQLVKVCHFPYSGDHTEAGERYKEWRPKNEGTWLIHGHVHGLWKVKDKQINVGVDVWDFKPVPITEIERIIKDE